MSEPTLDPELAALSAALGALAPAPPALDRDRLFFEAGRRFARPQRRGWPLATCALAVLSVGLGWRLVTTAVQRPIERTAAVAPSPARLPAAGVLSPSLEPRRSEVVILQQRSPDAPYLRLRDQMLRFGADALPNLPTAAPEPPDLPVRVRGRPDAARPSLWFLPLS